MALTQVCITNMQYLQLIVQDSAAAIIQRLSPTISKGIVAIRNCNKPQGA